MLVKMFWSFFKIGAFTFGGGYAMIPLIQEEVVSQQGWISEEEFMDILVISQTFPGALAVNCAIFIGYRLKGLKGGIISLLGVVLPSFSIMLLIANVFMAFRNNTYVNAGFKGITAAVPVLVLSGVISMSKGVKKNMTNGIIIGVALIALIIFDINPVIALIIGAIYGIIFLRDKGASNCD